MSAETKAVRAAGGKVSIVDPEHNEKSGYSSATQQFKKYGVEHGNASSKTEAFKTYGHGDTSYNSSTRIVVAKNGEVSIQPFKLHAAEGEGKHQGNNGQFTSSAGGKISTKTFSRPSNKKGGLGPKKGPKANWSKPYGPTPQAKVQQKGNTKGAKAK
jgi:hypothetical protein